MESHEWIIEFHNLIRIMGMQYRLVEIHNSVINVHNYFMDVHNYDLPFMILWTPHRPMTNWTRTGNNVRYLLGPTWRSQKKFIRYLWAGGNISGHYLQWNHVSVSDRRPLEHLFNSSFGLTSHKHQYPHNDPFWKELTEMQKSSPYYDRIGSVNWYLFLHWAKNK